MVVVKEAFDDVALLIGSVAAARKLPDDLIQVLLGRLHRIREQTLRRICDGHAKSTQRDEAVPPRIHPAVEDFLLGRGQKPLNPQPQNESNENLSNLTSQRL